MKRLLNFILALSLLMTILCPMTAYATDGNMDGSGGNTGDGTSQSFWNPGMDGIRATVVRSDSHEPVTSPIDFTNKKPTNIKIHFGKVSKVSYAGGMGLTPFTGTYTFVNPVQSMPRIISTSGGNSNIEAIKSYFCSEYIIKRIADISGMDYEVLIGGQFKILIEPVAYFKYNGIMMAMTAHEAALYDQQVDGKLRYWMGTVTHQNLPLAIFLETPDLGFPAWDGARSGKRTNEEIKTSLGLGIVRFEELPEPPQVTTYDYEYRTNTEVITSVMVSGGQSDPDNPTRVSFQIGGRTFNVGNVYYPEGDSQLAWVRWTTPEEPQLMAIHVTVSGSGSAQGVINVNIVDLDKNPPPNPVADDRNDSYTRPASTPVNEQRTSASWGIWRPWWYEYIVYHSDGEGGSYPCDHGWWAFDYDRYSANLEASMKLKPDDMSPTATATTMKSGYGVNQTVTAQVRTSQSSATTEPQNAVSYFTEFQYHTYGKLIPKCAGELLLAAAGRPGETGRRMCGLILDAVQDISGEVYLAACKQAIGTGDLERAKLFAAQAENCVKNLDPSLYGGMICHAYGEERKNIATALIQQCTPEQIAAADPLTLYLPAMRGDFHTMQALVEKGIDATGSAERILHTLYASHNGWMAEHLLDHGLKIDNQNVSALHACVRNGGLEGGKLLLDCGMDFEQYQRCAEQFAWGTDGHDDTLQVLAEHWAQLQPGPEQSGPAMGEQGLS